MTQGQKSHFTMWDLQVRNTKRLKVDRRWMEWRRSQRNLGSWHTCNSKSFSGIGVTDNFYNGVHVKASREAGGGVRMKTAESLLGVRLGTWDYSWPYDPRPMGRSKARVFGPTRVVSVPARPVGSVGPGPRPRHGVPARHDRGRHEEAQWAGPWHATHLA